MTITAKYPSTCAACHSAVAVGSKVEWVKGSRVVHAECASTRPAASRTTHRRDTQRGVCEECGERVTSGSRCWETGMQH